MRIAQIWAVMMLLGGACLLSAQDARPGISAADLEQALNRPQGSHQLAGPLLRMRLNERLASNDLARLQSHLPSSHDRAALWMLADEALDLRLPGTSVLPPPDSIAEKVIFDRALEYSKQFRARLPNLNATRSTTYMWVESKDLLDNQLAEFRWSKSAGQQIHAAEIGKVETRGPDTSRLFLLGTWEQPVTYRNGKDEYGSPQSTVGASLPPAMGLSTTGEFGELLGRILDDLRQGGTVRWIRWETGSAVYAYDIPESVSHFNVLASTANTSTLPVGRETPGYRGEINIDPESGAVERIALWTETQTEGIERRWKLAIDYAQVEIGGRLYWCPVRSVAISEIPPSPSDRKPTMRFINHTEFTGYHIFRTEVRILP